MNVAELPIEMGREKIEVFCRGRGIREASVFGSVLPDAVAQRICDLEPAS